MKPRHLPLFSAESESTCRILRRVSPDEAEKFEALGVWERRYDNYSGELMGFRIRTVSIDDSDLRSIRSTPSISVSEMQTNCLKSRTLGMPEVRRLEREKQGLPAEDHVERVQCKVIVFPYIGAAKQDILRVWPR